MEFKHNNLKTTKIGDFLNCLSEEIIKTCGGVNSESTPRKNYIHHIIKCIIKDPLDEKIELIWEIKVTKGEVLKSIEVSAPNGENEERWKKIVRNLIDNAINCINSPQANVSTCHIFGYFGPVLDGEYSFHNFRLTSAPNQNMLFGGMPKGVERIVYIYLNTKGYTREHAQEEARTKSLRFASLLSVFLDVGLDDMAHYDVETNVCYKENNRDFVFAYIPRSDGFKCESVQRGYNLIVNDIECHHGGYREVKRDNVEYIFPKLGDTLKCPSDIHVLFEKFEKLNKKKKDRYHGAAALFQQAEVHKFKDPSVSLAYAVSAIDALEGKSPRDDNIKKIIKQCYPQVSDELIHILSNAFRHEHFHRGKFNAGEFSIALRNPLSILKNSDVSAEFWIIKGLSILQSTLIKWLLLQ